MVTRFPVSIVFIVVLGLPIFSLAADFTAQVLAVLDGDTIEVLREDKGKERIRLYGIDCPEKRQPFSVKAKEAASVLMFGKEVKVETHGQDRHGRTLGTVFVAEKNVNQQLVREGWCWWFQKYAPRDTAMAQLEQQAKQGKRGLWADPNPVPPWLYRRLKSGAYP
jgi:micrococcal nuclease